MPAPVAVRLLTDPEQHDLLAGTLEAVNRACNAARGRALQGSLLSKAELRTVVKAELDRLKLPAAFSSACVERVTASLTRQKFSPYQSLTLPPTAVKWPASDRVTLPTRSGKRTVRVYIDRARGDLRPPLEGKRASLVFRNGEFELVEASTDTVAP